MLQGKTILIGVTGGIAAYKIPNLVSMLVKLHADVHVILTKNATEFIPPIPFESLTKHKCLIDTFDRNFTMEVEHVSLGKKADCVLIAPATANIIGKLAHGIADDMLSTTVLACRCPMLISPTMNTAMYENPIVQDNMKTLEKYGYTVIGAANGFLACGDAGAGKMPEPAELLQYILRAVACEKDLAGKKVLVTAGPTQEAIDPVRFVTNHSSGKMGYAIAKAAMLRGADVTLVSGPVALDPVPFVEMVNVVSAENMYNAVMAHQDADIIIKAAAVADYTPETVADNKIKKKDGDMAIPMKRTKDILGTLGQNKREGQFLCGFSMETENMLENSRKKLDKKNLDMVAANNVKVAGAGFQGDTNVLTLITRGAEVELPLMSKDQAAHQLLDAILKEIR